VIGGARGAIPSGASGAALNAHACRLRLPKSRIPVLGIGRTLQAAGEPSYLGNCHVVVAVAFAQMRTDGQGELDRNLLTGTGKATAPAASNHGRSSGCVTSSLRGARRAVED